METERIYEDCPECPGDSRPCHLCFGTGSVYRDEPITNEEDNE